MKRQALAPVLSLFILSVLSLPFLAVPGLHAQKVIPLWPHGTPEPPQTTEPEMDVTKPTDGLINGHRTVRLTNVTNPTLTIFQPRETTSEHHAAVVVFPGGGYKRLAWTGEGLDACSWINSLGMSCLLVKYRVPEEGRYPENLADLEDAQQAMRLARTHAAEWHINPHKIGVLGFSAGGHLAVTLSTHWDDHNVVTIPSTQGTRPDFAIVVYPAYLNADKSLQTLAPSLTPKPDTPPTFLIQAENDPYHVECSILYFRALKDAGVPVEMHLYATGGHGFGLHPVGSPEEHWTQLATAWLRSISMLPVQPADASSWKAPPAPTPCPSQEAPIGRPYATSTAPASDNPACW